MNENKQSKKMTALILCMSLLMVFFISSGSFFGYSIYEDRKHAAELQEQLKKLSEEGTVNLSANDEKLIQEENEIARLKNVVKEIDKTLKPAVKDFVETSNKLNKNVEQDKELERFNEMKSDVSTGNVSVQDIKDFAKELEQLTKDLKNKEQDYSEESKRSSLEDEIKKQQEEQKRREEEERLNRDRNNNDDSNNNTDNGNNDSNDSDGDKKTDKPKEKPDKDAWLDDLRVTLNSVGGKNYKLVEFDGNCNGKKADSCSTKGTIKVTKKVADYSHDKKVSLLTYEVAQQEILKKWDKVKDSEEFDSLFNKDKNKLANAMAFVKGAKVSEKFTNEQIEYAKTVWK